MTDSVYDCAVVGGGCAGFQLLDQLAQQPGWADRRVLLLTNDQPRQRSWCFWSRDPQPPVHHLIERSWPSVRFCSAGFSRTAPVAPYQYHYISGDRFFGYFNEQFLPQHPNITRVNCPVETISRATDGFILTGAGQSWRAHRVFSSRIPPIPAETPFRLWQHFSGWFVRTDRPVFDEQVATLMDFTVPQQGAVQFGYVLPFSATYALIELTAFSPTIHPQPQYTDLLTGYMATHFPGVRYTIEATEQGQIPMTDFSFARYGPAGETLIGTAAGMVKATTGYAFRRIFRDSAQLARHHSDGLSTGDRQRIDWPRTSGRFRFYDRLLLGIIAEQPERGVDVFSGLFQYGSFPDILRFLDEESDLITEINLIRRLPYTPFLTQLFRQWLR